MPPITPHPAADFNDTFRELVKFLGVADPNYPEGDEVIKTSPYTKTFLRRRLVKADVEVCLLIASVEGHPFRNSFFTEEPSAADSIDAGGMIPGFMGLHGGVKVRTSLPDADTEIWADGDLAQSFDHLKTARLRAKINRARYGEHRELYWIENGKIELVRSDLKARVRLPVIPVQNADDDETDLQLFAPFGYSNGVLANCIANMRVVGSNTAHRNDWTNIWSGYIQMILGKALNLPEPERMQRVAE